MKHQVKFNNISAVNNAHIVRSESLLGTSNTASSDWCIRSFFSIKDKKPYVRFEITTKLFGGDTLFETDNYEELENWIEAHMSEISNQIDTNAEDWIKRYSHLQ